MSHQYKVGDYVYYLPPFSNIDITIYRSKVIAVAPTGSVSYERGKGGRPTYNDRPKFPTFEAARQYLIAREEREIADAEALIARREGLLVRLHEMKELT